MATRNPCLYLPVGLPHQPNSTFTSGFSTTSGELYPLSSLRHCRANRRICNINLLCELTYCWGLAGTIQALITPNLLLDFPHPRYWSFFIQHGVIVVVALYLPLAMGWKPRDGVVPRVFLWNQIYFITAFCVNSILVTNFGFLVHKPNTPSLLDHLGDWPIYLLWLQLLAILLMTLLFLPFRRSINIWRSDRIGVNPRHE